MKTTILTQSPNHPITQSSSSKRLKQLVLSSVLVLFLVSVSFGQNYNTLIFDQVVVPGAISNVPVQNSSCQYQVGTHPWGDPIYEQPVRRSISRCQNISTNHVQIRPRMLPNTSIPLTVINNQVYTNGGYRIKVRVFVNGNIVRDYTSDAVSGAGSSVVTASSFNSLLSDFKTYVFSGSHNVHTVITIERGRWTGWFNLWRVWEVDRTLVTCNSTVSNVNGTPDFDVIAGNFVNNVWPNHYEVCFDDVFIQTTNTCNSSFNLFVAEINQNWQRPRVKEAERWFNQSNANINLQHFTQGFFSNTNFASDGPFLMGGGNVTTPNPDGVTGTRYFMVQVATTAPSWQIKVKVLRMQFCNNLVEPNDTNFEAMTTVYELEEFMEEFPELEEQVKEMIEEFAVVFPNPTENLATFRYSATKGKLRSLQALDQHGNLYPLPTEIRILEDFYQTPEMDISHLPQGIYTILAEYENSETIEKIRFNKK
jgi:hypothetical protein